MSVDRRTRFDDDESAGDIDARALMDGPLATAFGKFDHSCKRLVGRTPLPLLLEVEATQWTLRIHHDRPVLEAGDHTQPNRDSKRIHARFSQQQLSDLVTDQVTPIGMWTAGALDLPEGTINQLLDWWLILRASLDDDSWEDPAEVDLPDDLHRSFSLDDDPADILAFLSSAGFVHLRGVFTNAEMAQISADMDSAAAHYTEGDGNSWWATTSEGRELVRMQGFDRYSPTATELLDDPRFGALGALGGAGHRHEGLENNRIEALFKPLGVTEGISDIPWHKDCSLGRHSYECCGLTVGISVTGAGPTSGQLHVVAGSHRVLVWPSLLDVSTVGLPDIALATETGDVTVHLSCTLHMAEPPTERERRVLYTGFSLPQPNPEAAQTAKRRLQKAARESAPTTVTQPSTV